MGFLNTNIFLKFERNQYQSEYGERFHLGHRHEDYNPWIKGDSWIQSAKILTRCQFSQQPLSEFSEQKVGQDFRAWNNQNYEWGKGEG